MYCVNCGTQLSAGDAFCSECGTETKVNLASGNRTAAVVARPASSASMTFPRSSSDLRMVLGAVGCFVGGFVGFALRPAVFLVGQLPFEAVITRGGTLRGMDQLLVPAAQTSFNVMVAGAVLGAFAGAVLGMFIRKPAATDVHVTGGSSATAPRAEVAIADPALRGLCRSCGGAIGVDPGASGLCAACRSATA